MDDVYSRSGNAADPPYLAPDYLGTVVPAWQSTCIAATTARCCSASPTSR